MDLPKTLDIEHAACRTTEEKESTFERLAHLCPSRYFRYYMLFERGSYSTCWLPEGYDA